MPILYRHIRQDKKEPFYIRIGESENRAYETKGRTRAWKNISKKGYDVEVLFDDLSYFLVMFPNVSVDTLWIGESYILCLILEAAFSSSAEPKSKH